MSDWNTFGWTANGMYPEPNAAELLPARNIAIPDIWIDDGEKPHAGIERHNATMVACAFRSDREFPTLTDMLMMIDQSGVVVDQPETDIDPDLPELSADMEQAMVDEDEAKEKLRTQEMITPSNKSTKEEKEGDSARKTKKRELFFKFLDRELADKSIREDFSLFYRSYHDSIARNLVLHAKIGRKRLYQINSDGFLVKFWDWNSQLENYMWETRVSEEGLEYENFMVPLFAAYRRNEHWEGIMKVVSNADNCAKYRQLLCPDFKDASSSSLAGVYFLHPPWNLKAVSSEAVEDDDLLTVYESHPMEASGYLGYTQLFRQRYAGHKKEPVNSRMEQRYRTIPFRRWRMHIVAEFDKESLISGEAIHFVEHFLLSAFHFTDEDQGGCNYNVVDRFGYTMVILPLDVERLLRTFDRILEQDPTQLLPDSYDVHAWHQITDPILLPDTKASMSTVAKIVIETTREHIHKDVNPVHLDDYVDRMGNPDRNAEFLQTFPDHVWIRPRSANRVARLAIPRLLDMIPVILYWRWIS
ncbi:hypothetical protein I204_00609 [Kwoniella mangroviensis CBS 8886]|nr:hypothetical protein I204_00609 [Kwoniella mangroviensis CBS 8886]